MSERKALILARNALIGWQTYTITRTKHRDAVAAINSALAKPLRNCDRFGGDIDKLRDACLRERGLNPEEDFPDVFPEWLLAPMSKCNGGDCIRAKLCAEPCTDCPYCDEEGNL